MKPQRALPNPWARCLAPLCGLLLGLAAAGARADKLDDNLQTVWESLWNQRGVPVRLMRWDKPILYRIHGTDSDRIREQIRSALLAAAGTAHVDVTDVSFDPDAEATATLDLAVVSNQELADNEPCVTQHLRWNAWKLDKVRVKMRVGAAYRCAYHEMMHVMGVTGHPSGKTVLSYFTSRRDGLLDLDRLMLSAWYSPAMTPGATPLEALIVLSDAVRQQNDLGVSAEEAQARTLAFRRHCLREMEALALGQGEVPAIVLRSGKASPESMRNTRRIAAYFVGLAYRRGVIAEANLATSNGWIQRAAQWGQPASQFLWAQALTQGEGVPVDRVAAHAWLRASTRGGYGPAAAIALAELEKSLSPQELAAARAAPLPQVSSAWPP